jgi:hypothetical protein
VPQTVATGTLNLGFLTILHEQTGYVGGLLITNVWGRPLEFRLSTAVQPNRIQQILYGGTLQPYICADLIGKTLIEKTGLAAQCVFTDREEVLDLRRKVDVPVAWLNERNDPVSGMLISCPRPSSDGKSEVFCHGQFPGDVPRVQEVLQRLEEALDPMEPFSRIREAIGEARKMGVTARG